MVQLIRALCWMKDDSSTAFVAIVGLEMRHAPSAVRRVWGTPGGSPVDLFARWTIFCLTYPLNS